MVMIMVIIIITNCDNINAGDVVSMTIYNFDDAIGDAHGNSY